MASSVDSKNSQRLKGVKYVGTLTDGQIWKFDNASGNMIPGVDEGSTFEYEASFSGGEEVLQSFRFASSITAIHVANIDTLEYDINESGTFTALTIDGSGDVTSSLPLALVVNDTITWKITFSAGKENASANIIGNKV